MFNLSKHSQNVLDAPSELQSIIEDTTEVLEEPLKSGMPGEATENINDQNLSPDESEAVGLLNAQNIWNGLHNRLEGFDNGMRLVQILQSSSGVYRQLAKQMKQDYIPENAKNYGVTGIATMMTASPEERATIEQLVTYALNLSRAENQLVDQGSIAAFNLKKFKTAEVYLGEDQFVNQYLDELLLFNGRERQGDARSEQAKQQLLLLVSENGEHEGDSIIQTIQACDPEIERDKADRDLRIFYRKLVPQNRRSGMGLETTMSEQNPKGIIKFNLSDHVLNNQLSNSKMEKTAANQFGEQYLLYGPSEKRICPKLRGKNIGDVVSEYICRHHCLDGIVIDDNKTICGEALWRAHAMDKFSREYVDSDGNIVGGYLNKRFEINRNIPEENKMRLKPGEFRKPRPASEGSTESRMQDMRNKEGQQRGYRPDTNTAKPFDWTKDVDQNNVGVTQKERDRREENSGHQTVQYTKKEQQENNPVIAEDGSVTKLASIDLKAMKISDIVSETLRLKNKISALNKHSSDAVSQIINGCVNGIDNILAELSNRKSNEHKHTSQTFNLRQHKLAEMEDTDRAIQTATEAIDEAKALLENGKDHEKGKSTEVEKAASKVENDNIKNMGRKAFPDNTGCTTCTPSGEMPAKSGFNLKRHVTAQGGSISPVVNDGKEVKPKEQKYRENNIAPLNQKKTAETEKDVTDKGEPFKYNPWIKHQSRGDSKKKS